ncbi:hypothetical protein [Companilactobacillus sp.]|uniref:hypothetical protein n=1 Tax=Companilactobacillus sp. TaxID=2767905 RepID=UPI0026110EFF|nr:hypothetical protein [Companilactobacillus sp.]
MKILLKSVIGLILCPIIALSDYSFLVRVRKLVCWGMLSIVIFPTFAGVCLFAWMALWVVTYLHKFIWELQIFLELKKK